MSVLLQKQSRAQHRQRQTAPTAAAVVPWKHIRFALIMAGFVVVTVASFYPVVECKFINFDDDGYVTANAVVQHGLTREGVVWAFTSTPLNLWHPLSFISLMCDFALFGLEPAGYHLVNLLFHVASVVLLFVFLYWITGCVWRSAAVSALFAIHPLRVESVAWVAERKDVLAMFFGLLALLGYSAYCKRPTVWRYAIMAVLFLLSLLAKPMLLPLPGILLLLDYWPQKRLTNWKRAAWLVLEKIPLLLIGVGIVIVTQAFSAKSPAHHSDIYVQDSAQRKENAVISYVLYLEKMVDFSKLAVVYPIRPSPPAWEIAGAALLLVAVSVGAIALVRSRPWVLLGWVWFLIALLPVIGVGPQIGFHSMADRYTYFPCIGLFIAIVWSIPGQWQRHKLIRIATGVVTTAVLLTLALFTRWQIGYWHDSITLFEHAAAVTANNDFAEFSLGTAYWQDKGDAVNSIQHFEAALRMRPELSAAHDKLGVVLGSQKQTAKAVEQFTRAAAIDPNCVQTYNNWGVALVRGGDCVDAVPQFRRALAINNEYIDARGNLGFALSQLGRYDEAIEQYDTALQLAPGDPRLLAGLREVQISRARHRAR